MQFVVYHRFAYTCCTAFFQPFCEMPTIKYNVLNDRGFPQLCYRTLIEYKGSERRIQNQIYLGFVEPHPIFDEVKGSVSLRNALFFCL